MGNVVHQAKLLFQLQTIDMQIDSETKSAENCADAIEVSELRGRLNKIDRVVGKINERSDKLKRRIRRLELELQSLDDRMEKNERQLFDGSVQEVRGLSNLQEMLGADRRKKEEYEEATLLRMERLEKLQGEMVKTKRIKKTVKSRLADAMEKLKRVQAERSHKIDSLRIERKEIIQLISTDVYSVYDTMSRKIVRPVSKVGDRTCTGCNMTLPTSMKAPRDEQVSRCPHCTRILWWPVDEIDAPGMN